jgi:hypothetical protein
MRPINLAACLAITSLLGACQMEESCIGADARGTLEFYLASPLEAGDSGRSVSVGSQNYRLDGEALVGTPDIERLKRVKDANGKPLLELSFSDAGSRKLSKGTGDGVGRHLVTVLNGTAVAAVPIQSAIAGQPVHLVSPDGLDIFAAICGAP